MILFNEKKHSARALTLSVASITAQLKEEAPSGVFSDVILEGWRRPAHSECTALQAYGYSSSSLFWVREVLIYTGGTCRALARILVPEEKISLIPWVFRLGSQLFGELLYNAYSPKRECIDRQNALFGSSSRQFSLRARQVALEAGFQNKSAYWGRSSVLVVDGETSLHCFVTEIFL